MNPLNPEIMTGYANRLGTNRYNPYTEPGAYDRIGQRQPLPVFGNYLCTQNPTPSPPPPNEYLSERLASEIEKFVFGIGTENVGRAPPCQEQAPLGRLVGQSGRYPQLQPLPSDAAPGPYAVGVRKGDLFARLVAGVARHPLPVLAVTALLALGGAVLALRLEPSAATDTLVDRGSQSFEDTERFKQDFGDEAVLVLVRGELARTVLTADLGRLIRLEGCLSGNVPDNKEGLGNLPPVCREIAELDAAKVVFGPGTFINTAVNQIAGEFQKRLRANQRQAQAAAEAARKLSKRRGDPPAEQERLANAAVSAVQAQFVQQVFQLGLRYGLTDVPRIDDPDFVSRLVFDLGRGGGAEVALRLPVPVEERGDDHDPAASPA